MRDAKGLKKTKEYTRIIHLLRLYRDSLTELIQGWSVFQAGPLMMFRDMTGGQTVEAWNNQIGEIQREIAQLQSFRTGFLQKLDMFDALRNGVSDQNFLLGNSIWGSYTNV